MSGLWAWAEKQKPDFDALWAEAGSRTQCGPDDCSIRFAGRGMIYFRGIATIEVVVLELEESREQENRGFGDLKQMAIVTFLGVRARGA